MFLARRLQSSVGSSLPWWRRLGRSAAVSSASTGPAGAAAGALTPAPASSSLAPSRRALASFAGGPWGASSSRPFQQLDGNGGSGDGGSSTSNTSGSTSPLGVPHFEIRVYDMEEALEALTRQHSVPLGYVLPVEIEDRPAPSVDGPALAAAAAAPAALASEGGEGAPLSPRLAPATATASAVDSSLDEEGEGVVMECIKRTYQPSVLKRKRMHGFLSRLKTRDGRKILGRRRLKHRTRMGV